MKDSASATKAGPERKTLVAITIERELDLLGGEDRAWEEKVFANPT